MLKTPVCPLCSQPPVLILDGGHQCFCGTDGCPGFTWDAHMDLDSLLMSAKGIQITEPGKQDDQ